MLQRSVFCVAALLAGCATAPDDDGDEPAVTPGELAAPLSSPRPTQVVGQFLTLDADSSATAAAITAAVHAANTKLSVGGVRRPGWKGLQFEIHWPDLGDAKGVLSTDGASKLTALMQAAAADHFAVNLMFKWHGFRGLPAVPPGGAAREFHAVSKNESSVALWDDATLVAYRTFVRNIGDLVSAMPESGRVASVGFAETACAGCNTDVGYTALRLEDAMKALSLTVRRQYPPAVEINVYANFFPVEADTVNAKDQRWYVYDFIQWGSCSGRYVGIGAPDARQFDIGTGCLAKTAYDPPYIQVLMANGGALRGMVSESVSQQVPDFEVPNTALGELTNAVRTLGAAQVVWSDFGGSRGTACDQHAFTIDDVLALDGRIPASNAPTWSCVTAANPYQ